MEEKEIKDKLRSFLSRSFKDYQLKDDDDFVEMGLVHSLFIIQTIMFIEKHFGIELDDDAVDLEELRTINALCAVIKERLVNVVDK